MKTTKKRVVAIITALVIFSILATTAFAHYQKRVAPCYIFGLSSKGVISEALREEAMTAYESAALQDNGKSLVPSKMSAAFLQQLYDEYGVITVDTVDRDMPLERISEKYGINLN